MGFSSALIGSSMAFDFPMFHEIAPTLKGSDLSKAMETALLKQNIYTEYLEEVVCYSKKEESANGYEARRIGWLRSQYSSSIFALRKLPFALLRGEWDYANKLFQWLLPSRFLLIACLILITIIISIMDWTLSPKWYILIVAIGLSFLMAMPEGEISKRFGKAIWAFPILVFTSNISHIKRLIKTKKRDQKKE